MRLTSCRLKEAKLQMVGSSALWWLFLVTLASKASARITPSATHWLDLFSGLVLLVWGAWIAWGTL